MKRIVELDTLIIGGIWHVCVKFGYNAELYDIAKSMHMQFDYRFKYWRVPESRFSKQKVIKAFSSAATVVAADLSDVAEIIPTASEKIKLDINLNNEAKHHINRYKGILANRRYSDSTRKTYISLIQKFFSYYSDMDPLDLSMEELGKFNDEYIIANNYSINTQRQLISAIKLFYENTKHHSMEVEALIRPRKSRKIPTILEKSEIQLMIESTANLKHRTIISALYATGMRVSELLNLRMEDIHSEDMYISIRNAKGRKDRNIPLSDQLIKILRRYYKMYRPVIYMFEGAIGRQYSSSSVNNIVKAAAKRVGVIKDVSCHTIRHSYATHLLDKGVNLRYIQELLGHSSPKTTEIYTYVRPDHITRVQSPLDDFDDIVFEKKAKYSLRKPRYKHQNPSWQRKSYYNPP